MVENESKMKSTIQELVNQIKSLRRNLSDTIGERDSLIEDKRRLIEEKQKVSEERDLYGHQKNELIERNSILKKGYTQKVIL